IAHCNFQLRGEESERDEAFVQMLGTKYGVPVYVRRFETAQYAAQEKLSIQEAARVLRYQWFEQLRKEVQAQHVVLAHHANDAIETVLMHFFRGTGLEGLTGINEQVPQIKGIRPLLSVKRTEIEAFAREYNLQWMEDSSNSSSKYTRNFFRNEILPAIKKVYPQAEDNILSTIERLQQTAVLYQLLVQQLKKKLCKGDLPEVRIPIKQLMEYRHTSLIYEIIKEYGFGEKQVAEVIKLAESESGRYIENRQYQIIKHRAWFIIAPHTTAGHTYAIEKDNKKVAFSGGCLELRWVDKEKFVLHTSKSIAQLDTRQIQFPLLLRKWREGDYFYPLGMQKKKKLARFFIDQQISKNKKENIWVLESAQRIVWVIGYRIDDRFKITEKTKQVLQITWSSP
ncbi:MAG: tRNA lysidine(34) synthetase TilS, partial [Flavisolibacter sp.]|nr:tRNA lysidine(34) synthetase TilS [Flavisolibacter sp.]